MTERFKGKYYSSRKLFIADMQRVFSNCRAYNAADTEYVRCANTLERFFLNKIKELGIVDKWKPCNHVGLKDPLYFAFFKGFKDLENK